MATTQTVPLKLNVKKRQARTFRSFLETIPYVEVSAEESVTESRNTFVKGDYGPGENPADFAGAWSTGPERSLDDIRKKAWPTRK